MRESRNIPHSIEAEQSVLGGLMLDNRMFDDVAERVQASDFYRVDHQAIFAAIQAMMRAGKTCDLVTLSEHMRQAGTLDDAGGLAYLGSLALDAYSVSGILHYADIVRERALLRGLIAAGSQIMSIGYQPEGRDVQAAITEAERLVLGVREHGEADMSLPPEMSDLYAPWLENLERAQRGEVRTGLMSGLSDLDRKTTGFHPGDLVVVGARPSMGKTALALNIASNVARDGGCVAFFSMEMRDDQIMSRHVAGLARVGLQRMRQPGGLTDDEFARISLVAANPEKIVIDDRANLTADQVCAAALRLNRRKKLSMIVLDYLQLIRGTGEENRTRELEAASHAFKRLAKDLGIPFLALAQVNRACEMRDNKRPRMADLRDCGSFEADADTVIFIYRDEVYNEQSPDRGTAELIVAKQRNGPIGTVRTSFLPEFCRFENLPADWRPMEIEASVKRTRGFRTQSASATAPYQDREAA